jgi:hypothetical protein
MTGTGTIITLRGSWSSGIATLVVKQGKTVRSLYADNGPLVRALDKMFGGVIAPGHRVDLDAIRGRKIRFTTDDFGMIASLELLD